MGPDIQNVERTSQATPLAGNVLQELQGELDQGAFGHGVGPQQRMSADHIARFVEQLMSGGTASQVGDNTGQLIGAVTERSRVGTDRAAADLREGFGVAGARTGTSAAIGEAWLRGDARTGLDQIIAQILTDQGAREQQARQFDIGALLSGIQTQNQFGTNAMAPFMQALALGVLPDEIIASPGVGDQILNAGLQVASAYAGAPGGFQPQGPSNVSGPGFGYQPGHFTNQQFLPPPSNPPFQLTFPQPRG